VRTASGRCFVLRMKRSRFGGELVALKIRDIDFYPDGTGQALIRRGKTDPQGQGRAAYLSRETCRWLKLWLENAKISVKGQCFGD
jgi:hypothetical protein